MKRAGLVLFLSAFVALAGDNQSKDPEAIGQRKVDGGVNFYSIQKELSLGKQLAIEVERQTKLLKDPISTEYINRLTQNLVRNSDVKFPVTVKVIDDDVVNAFTLPGGYLFVNTGIIRLSESEAELASVISHELGHVAARHYTREATRLKLLNAGSVPLIFLGGIAGLAAEFADTVALPAGVMKFSRNFETEADMLGIQYLYKTGYDPDASIDMFERIEAAERRRPGAVSQLFNSHPLTSDRITRTQHNIEKYLPARPEYVVNTSEYELVRARLVAMHGEQKAAPAPKTPTLLRKPAETDQP